jgi:hypothetical protein
VTTENQDAWAQYLEGASPREIQQMAEYAIDHIDSLHDATVLKAYLDEHLWCLKERDR